MPIAATIAPEPTQPRTPAPVSLPAKWQCLFDSIVASNVLVGGQAREHAEAVALAMVERVMRAAPFSPRRDLATGETDLERAERHLRECDGPPPGRVEGERR